jgi:hypothetical protein
MINDVYELTQDLLNKNGRGIITPSRFLHIAKNSQIKLVCNAIDEYIRAKHVANSTGNYEKMNLLSSVMEIFTTSKMLSRKDGTIVRPYHTLPSDYMMWGNLSVNDIDIVKVKSSDQSLIRRNYFISPTEENPFCYVEESKVYVMPTTIGVIRDGNVNVATDEVLCTYYRYPKTPNWTYVMIGDKFIFNESNSAYQDFELPLSYMNRLVIDILMQLGVHLRDTTMLNYTISEDKSEQNKDNSM